MTELTLAAKVKEALNKLLPSPVEELRRRGIHGIRRSSGKCPVAIFLKQEFPDALGVCVRSCWSTVIFAVDTCVVDNGEVLQEMILKFDKEEYPELEE